MKKQELVDGMFHGKSMSSQQQMGIYKSHRRRLKNVEIVHFVASQQNVGTKEFSLLQI